MVTVQPSRYLGRVEEASQDKQSQHRTAKEVKQQENGRKTVWILPEFLLKAREESTCQSERGADIMGSIIAVSSKP